MTRTRTTLTVDERLLRAARTEAVREGKHAYEVIEEALRDRYDLRLAIERVHCADAIELSDEDATSLAVREQKAVLEAAARAR